MTNPIVPKVSLYGFPIGGFVNPCSAGFWARLAISITVVSVETENLENCC